MKYFLHRCLYCGVQPKAMWNGDQCEGVPLAKKIQELGQQVYVHKATLKKLLELNLLVMWKEEKWKRVVAICIIFHAYFMELHWLSYGTLSTGLESKIIPTVINRHSECHTTWTLCATWIVFSAFRIALWLCRILCVYVCVCVWTVSFGALHIFSRHPVTSARISMPRHFVVSFH